MVQVDSAPRHREPGQDQPNGHTGLWRCLASSRFEPPQETVTGTVMTGISGFLGKLFPPSPKVMNLTPVIANSLLKRPGSDGLDCAAPVPDWSDAASSLAGAVEESDAAGGSVTLVVGPPWSYNADIVTRTAALLGRDIIESPDPRRVLSGTADLTISFQGKDSGWVVPAIERWFFRHHLGLGRFREFFRHLLAGSFGRGLVGCDSWTWQYLSGVLGVSSRSPISFSAFAAEDLAKWFSSLPSSSPGPSSYSFKATDDGHLVVPPRELYESSAAEAFKPGKFLVRLAARARGNPGLALAMWRNHLMNGLDAKPADPGTENSDQSGGKPASAAESTPCVEAQSGHADQTGNAGGTIWVLPWNDAIEPKVPPGICRESLILLHSLLVHNGLREEHLADILPMTAGRLSANLGQLMESGVVEGGPCLLRVSPLAYPGVRGLLSDYGYFVDGF